MLTCQLLLHNARAVGRKRILLPLLAAVLALSACGEDEETESPPEAAATETQVQDTAAPADRAPLREGGIFHVNDLADCLLDAGVGAAVSLDGASIELHDAMSQVIVEQGNAEILVYGSADAAAAQEAGYRRSFGRLSEVKLVRNVLVQTDPELPAQVKAQLDGCTGA